eukprot:9482321-Pyramimonas_sp.AAC.2
MYPRGSGPDQGEHNRNGTLPFVRKLPSALSTDPARPGNTDVGQSSVMLRPGQPSTRSRLRRSAYAICHASTSCSANSILSWVRAWRSRRAPI